MIRFLFAAALFLPITVHAETFDEMWNRRIAEPLGWAPEPVKVKTIEIKPTKQVEPVHHRSHRR